MCVIGQMVERWCHFGGRLDMLTLTYFRLRKVQDKWMPPHIITKLVVLHLLLPKHTLRWILWKPFFNKWRNITNDGRDSVYIIWLHRTFSWRRCFCPVESLRESVWFFNLWSFFTQRESKRKLVWLKVTFFSQSPMKQQSAEWIDVILTASFKIKSHGYQH